MADILSCIFGCRSCDMLAGRSRATSVCLYVAADWSILHDRHHFLKKYNGIHSEWIIKFCKPSFKLFHYKNSKFVGKVHSGNYFIIWLLICIQ